MSGRVLDLILLGMALEGTVLTLLFRRRGQGVPPGALWPNLLSGMCLLLAMRAGLAGAWWGWVSLPLLGALAFHVADLRRLWRPVAAPVPPGSGPGRKELRRQRDATLLRKAAPAALHGGFRFPKKGNRT